MAISVTDMNQARVDILGRSVDQPGASWTTAPPGGANTLNTAERIPNRAINALDANVTNALAGTNGFATRFSAVIGQESAADQADWDAIGSNLITAVAALKAGGAGGGVVIGGIGDTTPPDPADQTDGNLWYRMVDGKMFLFGYGAWFQVF